nr:hypothetical protein [Myxococcota bacterium]
PIFLECAREAPEDRARAALERRAAEEWLKSGRIDEGVAVLRGVLSGVGLRYPDSQREALARAVVRILRLRASKATFTERAESSIPKEVLARVDAARVAGTGLMVVDPLRGYGFLARFLLDALAAGEPRRVAAGLSLNAVTLCRGGETGYPKAKRWLDDARAIGARLDDPYLEGLTDACEAGISVCTGRWKRGAELGLRAPDRLRATTTPATWECTVAGSLARSALLFAGDLATLRPLTARQLRSAEDVGDLFAATYARVHGWFEAAMDDDIARGRAQQDAALERWSHLGFHAMHFWSLYGQLQYDLYEGHAAQGLARLAKVRTTLQGSRILAMQFYRIFLTATEASLELGAATPRDREDRARQATKLARALEKEGPHYARALAAITRGRIARLRGHEEDAASWCGRAIDLFDVSEMALHAAAARASHGALIGGESGATERATALTSIAARGVRAPERWVAMLVGA